MSPRCPGGSVLAAWFGLGGQGGLDAFRDSAAFPVVFGPIPIRAYPRTCGYEEPAPLRDARLDRRACPAVRAYTEAQALYAERGRVGEVRLLDGGMSDTFGVTGFLADRLRDGTPHALMSPEETVRVRRVLFLAVDSAVRGRRIRATNTTSTPRSLALCSVASMRGVALG